MSWEEEEQFIEVAVVSPKSYWELPQAEGGVSGAPHDARANHFFVASQTYKHDFSYLEVTGPD